MSFVQPETLQVIADSVGVSKLSADAAKVLAPDIEYRLREIIQEAVKFKRHSKRSLLSTDDISQALRLRNVQPAYGFATSNKDAARFLRAVGHPDLWFLEDKEASFDQVVGSSLPRPPIEVGLLPHWLVVDGVQPAIPENAPLERPRARKRPRNSTAAAAAAVPLPAATVPATTAGAAPKAPGPPSAEQAQPDGSVVRAPVKHVLSQELQLYFDKVSELLVNGGEAIAAAEGAVAAPAAAAPLPGGQQAAAAGPTAAGGAAAGSSGAAGSIGEQLERAVLASLSSDPGLAPLVPYLVQSIAEGVAGGLKHLSRLRRLLGAAAALLANRHVGLASYLHQLLPPVLTCLVARRLGDPAGAAEHWEVREAAARLVRCICTTFADPLYNIQPRVSRTLLKALLDRSKPLTTHYGAIVGLTALGPRTVRLLLLPCLAPYLEQLQPLLAEQGRATGGDSKPGDSKRKLRDQVKQAEALHCYGALQAAAAAAVYASASDRLVDLLLTAPPAKRQRPEPLAKDAAGAGADAAQPSEQAAGEKGAQSAAERPGAGGKKEGKEQAGGEESAATAATAPAGATAGEERAPSGGGADGSEAAAVGEVAAKQAAVSTDGANGVAAASNGAAWQRAQPLDRRKIAEKVPDANALADAWKEDSDLAAQLQAVAELFGESVLPWVPYQAIGDVVL